LISLLLSFVSEFGYIRFLFESLNLRKYVLKRQANFSFFFFKYFAASTTNSLRWKSDLLVYEQINHSLKKEVFDRGLWSFYQLYFLFCFSSVLEERACCIKLWKSSRREKLTLNRCEHPLALPCFCWLFWLGIELERCGICDRFVLVLGV